MDNEKYLVPDNGPEDKVLLTEEEKAAEEKATRRHFYICARVAVDNLTKNIQRIESGACASGNLEFLQAQLAHSRRLVAQFEAEFIDDPNIERDIRLEIQAVEEIARAFSRKKGMDK